MKNVIEISIDDNTILYIEEPEEYRIIDDSELRVPVDSNTKKVKKDKQFFGKSINQIRVFSETIAEGINNSKIKPDGIELEFSVKFAADAGIVISTVSTEANVIVRMKWEKK